MKQRSAPIRRCAWPLCLTVMALGCTLPQPEQDAPPEGSYEARARRLSVDGTTETVRGAAVSRAFFERETARPMLGRTFVELDYGSSSPAVAVAAGAMPSSHFTLCGSSELPPPSLEISR